MLPNQGWFNTADWEGGFIYPKVEVRKTSTAVIERARQVQGLCEEHSVEILNIDADTCPDVEQSHFITLYRAPR